MTFKKKIYIAGHTGMVGTALKDFFSSDSQYELLISSRDDLDLTQQTQTYEWLKENTPDITIIAAAKVGGIQANIDSPYCFASENIQIAQNLIHGSYLSGVKRLIFLGSSCMYPKNCPQPMKEDNLLSGPCEPTNEGYAIAKIMGWTLCKTLRMQYGVDYSCVVPCNLYGKNDTYDPKNSHVIPALIMRMHNAKKNRKPLVEIWGSGEARREFLNTSDFVRAIKVLLDQTILPSIINVGYGSDISIRELAYIIKEVIGFEGDFVFESNKSEGMKKRLMDSTQLENIKSISKTGIYDGIKQVYKEFKKKYE